jgi:hypothetical protein
MPQQLDPNELREVAKFVAETSLEALTAYSELSFPPVVGNLQDFPRPSLEGRAAQQGFVVLREEVEEAVAALHALAAAIDHRLPVPPALQVRVQPYVNAYRAERRQ